MISDINLEEVKDGSRRLGEPIILQESDEPAICPAEVVRAYMVIRPGRDGQPLYSW